MVFVTAACSPGAVIRVARCEPGTSSAAAVTATASTAMAMNRARRERMVLPSRTSSGQRDAADVPKSSPPPLLMMSASASSSRGSYTAGSTSPMSTISEAEPGLKGKPAPGQSLDRSTVPATAMAAATRPAAIQKARW